MSDNVIKAIKEAGGVENLPVIDGPRLDAFDCAELAKAIETEVQRAKQMGWSKVSLHMDLVDALALAQALKGDNNGNSNTR